MVKSIARAVFAARPLLLILFLLGTVFLGWASSKLRIDAGFEKLLPKDHPFMDTYRDHREIFGGANRILVAVRATDGNLFSPASMVAAKRVSDRLGSVNGVNEGTMASIFTPNTRFYEITPEGFVGDKVVFSGCFLDYKEIVDAIEQGNELNEQQASAVAADLQAIRENVIKSGQVGRLVSSDFSSVLVRANLNEVDLDGKKLDPLEVAEQLEAEIRQAFIEDNTEIDVHIIGFAKSMGDIAGGAKTVVFFFFIAILVTLLLVYLFTHSLRLTVLPVLCSLIAVAWTMGLLPLLGFGLDPMSMLVPFLVFAIGVSHGVQMINAFAEEAETGHDAKASARNAFERLFVPGAIALVSDTIGFLTIQLIRIPIIQELALTASIGVGVILLTNLFLLPLLLSFVNLDERFVNRRHRGHARLNGLWNFFTGFSGKTGAIIAIAAALLLAALGWMQGQKLQVGDLEPGVPELRQSSRYNQDTAMIVDKFSIGVDILTIIVETVENACISNELMSAIDQYEWELSNVPGVQSTLSLPKVARILNAGNFQGSLKWRTLARDQNVLMASQQYIDTSTGLFNRQECDVMCIMVFLEDHKAETLTRVTDHALALADSMNQTDPKLTFRLATGNAGVMAATNEVVKGAQLKIMLYIYAAIIVLCLLTFRSVRGMLCIVIPLSVVSILCYAVMSLLGIGLKVSTLPVAALGAGIGVDYGIYIFSGLRRKLKENGGDLSAAYRETLGVTGNAVLVTGLTLAIGVSTWIFSALKFQADMGILLTFMFLGNMLGALILLPALARVLFRERANATDS